MNIDEFRKLIVDKAEEHYRFSDNEYGLSLIAKEEIVEEGPGIAVARFRLDVKQGLHLQFFAKYICNLIHDEVRVLIDRREEYGLPYLECVWVMQIPKDDSNREVNQDKGKDEEEKNEKVEELVESDDSATPIYGEDVVPDKDEAWFA